MGHEIVYCVQCGTKIPGVDFERGKAFRVGAKIICAACVPTLSLEEQKEISLSSTRIKAVQQGVSQGSSVRIVHAQGDAEAAGSGKGILLACVAGALVVLAALGVFATRKEPSRREAQRDPVPQPSANISAPAETREDPQMLEARNAIELARAKMKSSPEDLDAQIAAWEEAVRKAALTPYLREANSVLQGLQDRRAAALKPPEPKPIDKPVVKAPVEPAPKPVSPDLKTFSLRWQGAMAKASARDFDGAVTDLGRAAADLSDEDVRKRARADAEELKQAGAMLTQTQEALARLSRGQAVALRCRNEKGEWIEVKGTLLRAASARAEIRSGDATVFVEAEDVGIASLAKLLDDQTEAERRALALLCLLEGDRKSAERLVQREALPPKYWEYAGSAAAKPPLPTPKELEARSRLYAAEREFLKMETLAAAVQKYKSLSADYADTRVVRSELARIQKRAEAGKDYVLMSPALKGSGGFGLAPGSRTELAWVSKQDVEGPQAAENFVEAEFAALPDLTYRCWALVGGCCAENFVFYLQTTEGSELHPKTRQKTPIDPGAGFAAPVKHSLSGLKKTHEEHKIKGSKTHPKTASRWEWIFIPLPKYSAPGAKKIRLISDQQGFGVGAFVVSSTRSGPLPEAELKEEAARVRSLMASMEEGLVGWWRLDETAGSLVSNAVLGGHDGTMIGAPKGGPGKVGGAWKFDTGDSVRIDGSYSFKTLTLSAWVKHEKFIAANQRYVTLANETAVLRAQGDKGHFYIRTNGELRHLYSPAPLEPGKWMLITGTWDGTTQKLYRDGVLIGSQTPVGTLTSQVSFLHISSPSKEPMHGLIDEVRLYNRALGEAEIKKLYADGAQGIIAEATAPPAPPVPVGKPWRALFDGKSLDCIRSSPSWKLEGGAIESIPNVCDAAQSREEFGDMEMRIRFEHKDVSRVFFNFRQGGGGGHYIAWEDELKAMEGKVHEIVFVAKGEDVSATLDGKPARITSSGSAKTGLLQFNYRGKTLRILSIEVR